MVVSTRRPNQRRERSPTAQSRESLARKLYIVPAEVESVISQLRLADLAPSRSELPRCAFQALYPEIPARLTLVQLHLLVEVVHTNASCIDLVDYGRSRNVSDYNVTLIRQPKLPQLVDALYLTRLFHAARGNTGLDIRLRRRRYATGAISTRPPFP